MGAVGELYLGATGGYISAGSPCLECVQGWVGSPGALGARSEGPPEEAMDWPLLGELIIFEPPQWAWLMIPGRLQNHCSGPLAWAEIKGKWAPPAELIPQSGELRRLLAVVVVCDCLLSNFTNGRSGAAEIRDQELGPLPLFAPPAGEATKLGRSAARRLGGFGFVRAGGRGALARAARLEARRAPGAGSPSQSSSRAEGAKVFVPGRRRPADRRRQQQRGGQPPAADQKPTAGRPAEPRTRRGPEDDNKKHAQRLSC